LEPLEAEVAEEDEADTLLEQEEEETAVVVEKAVVGANMASVAADVKVRVRVEE